MYEPGVGWKEPPGWDCDHCLRMNLFILNIIVAGQCTIVQRMITMVVINIQISVAAPPGHLVLYDSPWLLNMFNS